MSHRAGTLKPIARLGVTALIATAVVTVVLLAVAAYNMSSGNSSAATASGVYWQGTAGETEEVAVRLPLNSWWDVDSNKPVIVRLADGRRFEARPDGSTYKIEPDGKLGESVEKIGRAPGSIIYLSAKKGEKMIKVAVLATRKASGEMKPAPTPATTLPAPPSTGATPLPPARPISPKSGMV